MAQHIIKLWNLVHHNTQWHMVHHFISALLDLIRTIYQRLQLLKLRQMLTTLPSMEPGLPSLGECSFYQDTHMQSMCMPDHQLVLVAYDDTDQDVIMQNKASANVAMSQHSPLACTGAMQFHCLQQCIKTNRFRFHVVRL